MDRADPPVTATWRRLDVAGADSCRVVPFGRGWRLTGAATFEDDRGRAELQYQVEADTAWQTSRGVVRGVVGPSPIALVVERNASGTWVVDGAPAADLDGLIDLDLGFTPATNLLPLRRLSLAIGESALVESALLDEHSWTFRRLAQRYERMDEEHYHYESPSGGYEGVLRVRADGVVLHYPGLWVVSE